jgi:hypothetical protein
MYAKEKKKIINLNINTKKLAYDASLGGSDLSLGY